jgi:hypothetical protein
MPNVAFHHEVVNKVISSPSTFAELGAIGPDLYQYLPISSDLSDTLDKIYQSVLGGGAVPNPLTSDPTLSAELNEKPLMSAYSLLFREIVEPFWPVLQREADVLGKLQTIANNHDQPGLDALLAVFGNKLDQVLNDDAAQLKKLAPAGAAYQKMMPSFVQIAPPIQRGAPAKPWDPTENRPSEFLRWHRTDKFAQSLVKNGTSANQQAYVQGHLCHVASAVTGEPFVNNIVGGPYRTHWWRNRFAGNFVDAWTFGRYETPATISGDTPSPAYGSWKDIRQSNLQKNFDVAGFGSPTDHLPDALKAVASGDLTALSLLLPAEIADLLRKTIKDTWLLPANRPKDFADDLHIDAATRQSFVGLFAVAWFMTSGFGPMTPFDLGAPPSSCTSTPTWVTSGGPPPSPKKSGPSTGATVCGVILAILALILFLFQQWALGAAAVAGAIALFESGKGIDFDVLACDVWWLRQMLLQAENALVNSLVLAGLAYPAPEKLGTVDGSGNWTPANGVSMVGNTDFTPLTKSNPGAPASGTAPVFLYPTQMDPTNPLGLPPDNDFGAYPPAAQENIPTMNYPPSPNANQPFGYADMVVDGSAPQTPGLKNGGMVTASPFPSRNAYFGDAVANAKQLTSSGPSKVPSYNLDADRGYGWLTWIVDTGTFPNTGNVSAHQEL